MNGNFTRLQSILSLSSFISLMPQLHLTAPANFFFQRRIWENFHQIRLRPENFPDLLINEIGFERYQTVGRPHHSAHGFSRQLQLFTKVGRRGPALPDREGG